MLFYTMLTIGFLFAYINGMHDGGTIVATTITSRIFSPKKAVLLAGLANLLGALLLGTAVASTIGTGMLHLSFVQDKNSSVIQLFVISAFLGSILWNVFTWIIKLPSSASHSMIGSMIGTGILAFSLESVNWITFSIKVVFAMLLSPLLGFFFGYMAYRLERLLLKRAHLHNKARLKRLHKISTLFLALNYGSNDSQKVMGLLAIGFLSGNRDEFYIPIVVIVGCSFALSIGTMTGGYNMIRTVGSGIFKINYITSFASCLSTIGVTTLANSTGIPISVTQVITSSVMGVGSGKNIRQVNWTVSKKILVAWFITIPASMMAGAFVFFALNRMKGLI